MSITKSAIFFVISSVIPWISFSSCHSDAPPPQDKKVSEQPHLIVPEFDAANAYQLTAKQVSFGSRVPNTKPHAVCREFLVNELRKYADTVTEQSFSQTVYGTKWNLTNIIARFNTQQQQRILLCAHWDSRPRSDEDSVPANRSKGIPAANDGASGVGILLELAKILKSQPPNIGVDIVFFDGEDIGYASDGDNFCIGSKYFATNMPLPIKPQFAVLLDLVGDIEAKFKIEQQSLQAAPDIVNRIWQLGAQHASTYFVNEIGGAITDDHLPLINAGIPAVDIIDMELVGNTSSNPRRRYWHTQYDTMSNIGENTLNGVGTVLLHLVYSTTP